MEIDELAFYQIYIYRELYRDGAVTTCFYTDPCIIIIVITIGYIHFFLSVLRPRRKNNASLMAGRTKSFTCSAFELYTHAYIVVVFVLDSLCVHILWISIGKKKKINLKAGITVG